MAVLAGLVVLGSAACVGLALTEPDPAPDPPGPPRLEAGQYRPADFAAPAGPALRAATTTVPLALTYDFRSLSASRQAATAGMTPAFARRFSAVFDRAAAPFVRRKEVTDAVVEAAGVVSAGPTRVRCLLVVDQRLLQSTADQGTIAPRVVSRSRVVVDLVPADGADGSGGSGGSGGSDGSGASWQVDDISRL